MTMENEGNDAVHATLTGTLKRLSLTTLATAAPALLETARQQQWPYETFLQQALVHNHAALSGIVRCGSWEQPT